jgi:hypothetical protein
MKKFKSHRPLGLDSMIEFKLDRNLGQIVDDFVYVELYLKLRNMEVILIRNWITEQLRNEELNED